MALETYREKRDFAATPEPRGGTGGQTGNNFVIQKHDATRLHYDFRLEMDGALKSWAVTKGPSLTPGEKRLAVHVEDHPLEYGDFEGTIPEGEYGGGTVIVWDRGTWTPIHDAHKGYAKGHLEFELHGEKLGGRWHLVRMHGKPREKRENWLLIKGEDEAARSESDPDILTEHPESVKTGRQIEDVAGEEPGWSSKTGKIEKKGNNRPKATPVTPVFGKLSRMQVPSSPFAKGLSAEEARQVRYVRPESVAEVEFRAWTGDGHLRHASFRGLREDKPARDIVRETVKTATIQPKPQQRTVKLTHPDRIYWPDAGVTKEGLADYYAEVWRYIAPHIVGRPLALLRCPSGITGQHFFQKHAWKGINTHIALVKDPKDPAQEPLISINDLDGLMGLVQSAVLEIHPWGSTLADWERPDTIIMDLDPGEGVPWEAVIAAAKETRNRLHEAGLAAFVKTSGGKGLHVVSPLVPKAEWPEVKAFSKAIADAMAADSPNSFVSTITKSKRQGKILVDYLRNQRGATAVSAYSTRARPGAAVSAPLAWEELGDPIGPAYFTVENMPPRLASLRADPWEDLRAAAAPLDAGKLRRRKVV
jgi:DNA ligase D-like protein (predicted polymerase)/DNA ligase D-like protein (predicted 3'-phosphoesterase)